MATLSAVIDLDLPRSARAARREGHGDHVTVRFHGQEFHLPPELPASLIDLVLDGRLDIAGLLATAMRLSADTSVDPDARDDAGRAVAETLTAAPTLPVDVLRTVRDALAVLFGPQQWQKFLDLAPSLTDMAVLIKHLWTEYGTSLGEAWGSPGPSATGGTTSKPTSNGTTASTPAAFGLLPATPST